LARSPGSRAAMRFRPSGPSKGGAEAEAAACGASHCQQHQRRLGDSGACAKSAEGPGSQRPSFVR
jgi:hypothetical protein